MSDRIDRRRELKEAYIEELVESTPTMSLTPLPDWFVREMFRAGLLVCGGPGTGKSNVSKVILSQLIGGSIPDVQVKITDSAQIWIHGFEPIIYQHINEDTIFPNDIYLGDDHILYDLEFWDFDMVRDTIGNLVSTDYDIQRLYKKEDLMDNHIVWCIEEAQNILGRYVLTGNSGKRWLKLISEMRNFNISFVWIGQRISDVATQAIERVQNYLIGKSVGDNDLRKIQRICGSDSGVHEMVPRLEVGQFIYWNGSQAYRVTDVPLYRPTTKPILWKYGMGVG